MRFFPLLLLLLNNCEKSSTKNEVILQNEWRVQSIQKEKDFIKVPSDKNLGKDAYVLRFDGNTTICQQVLMKRVENIKFFPKDI